jgi:hypothetical protein
MTSMAERPVEGFCYTHLTDIEQERNGLVTFDRCAKTDPVILLGITKPRSGANISCNPKPHDGLILPNPSKP